MSTLRAGVFLTAAGLLAAAAFLPDLSANAQTALKPQSMPKIADVDPRYLSYNVETVEVTGGRFWKPYKDVSSSGEPPARGQANQPVGIDPSLLQYRPPIDLSNSKLRTLASALAPSFMRVSGTWRNST